MNALLMDLYQLTMAYGYYRSGMQNHDAVFHLFFRTNPFKGGYAIAAGLENAIAFIKNFKFSKTDISYLASLKTEKHHALFDKDFLDYLKNVCFDLDIDAMPEGTVVFPDEPLLRVKGNLIQAQLLETALLNFLNFPTLIATKASRLCYAAKGAPVLEFGLRRAQGPDGGLTASRAAYIGGCTGTSNVLAGKFYNIPVKGTQAHSWVMAFPSEIEAFEKFSSAMPENCYLLMDTFNTLEAVKKAINICPKNLKGIRLDSGDLAYLSIQARKLLDKAGLHHVKIMASNDLDEYIIASLMDQKAKINVWASGTKLATAYDQPALDGVYKLSALRNPGSKTWENKLKLSEQNIKTSTPGLLNVRRFYNAKKKPIADCIYDERNQRYLFQHHQKNSAFLTMMDKTDPTRQKKLALSLSHESLLKTVFKRGKCVYACPSLESIRNRVQSQLAIFDPSIRRFLNPHTYPVGLEKNLFNARMDLILKIKQNVIL